MGKPRTCKLTLDITSHIQVTCLHGITLSIAISFRVEGVQQGFLHVVSLSAVSLTSAPDLFTTLLTLPSAMARFDMAIHNPPNREALTNLGPDEVMGTYMGGSDLYMMP